MIEYLVKPLSSDMERTSAQIVHAGGDTAPRVPITILAGILAYRSAWSPPFGGSFREYVLKMNQAERLDIGCSVCDGGFEVVFDIDGISQIETSNAEQALVFLYGCCIDSRLWGQVTAIDYAAYAKWIK